MGVRRIGLIGDVHGEHVRLASALDWLAGQSVDAVLCTGDIADGPGCINDCCELLQQAQAITVAGNHDRWLLNDRVRHVPNAHSKSELTDASLEFMSALPKTARLETAVGEMLLCHGVCENDLGKVWPGTQRSPIERSVAFDDLLSDGGVRFVVNGHMHYRVVIDFQETVLVNAGTLRGDHSGVSIVDFEEDWIAAYEPDGQDRERPIAKHGLFNRDRRRVWQDTQAFDGTWEPVTLHKGL